MDPKSPSSGQALSYNEVAARLPHIQPWLLVNRVVKWTAAKNIVAEMCLQSDHVFVRTHFPKGPDIIPGVLLIEFVGQAAHLLVLLSQDAHLPLNSEVMQIRAQPRDDSSQSSAIQLLARCRAQFLSPARAGELLTARVELKSVVRGVSVHHGVVTVDNREVCRVEMIGASHGLPQS